LDDYGAVLNGTMSAFDGGRPSIAAFLCEQRNAIQCGLDHGCPFYASKKDHGANLPFRIYSISLAAKD
jgi:hypothetical protein